MPEFLCDIDIIMLATDWIVVTGSPVASDAAPVLSLNVANRDKMTNKAIYF